MWVGCLQRSTLILYLAKMVKAASFAVATIMQIRITQVYSYVDALA